MLFCWTEVWPHSERNELCKRWPVRAERWLEGLKTINLPVKTEGSEIAVDNLYFFLLHHLHHSLHFIYFS